MQSKILQAVRIDEHAFIQECALLENFVKRGYMHLNKRPCAAIRDVRLFEVVRYANFNLLFVLSLSKSTRAVAMSDISNYKPRH